MSQHREIVCKIASLVRGTLLYERRTKKKGTSGIAGEFYVAAELTRRGMIATLTGKNTQDVDILALNPTTGAMISIQVKEKSTNVPGFYVSNKTEIIDRQKRLGIWYICVDLFNQNKCYIANTDQIFTGAMQREKEYLHRNNGLCEKGKRKGEPKKPSPSLWFIPELDGVKENNWEELPIFKATTEWT